MTVTVYGIPNCDSIKKARRWLDENGVTYRFHDYKKHGIDEASLERWAGEVGWETLLNRRGTTWRKLTEEEQADVNEEKAIVLMKAHNALIKRPVIEHDSGPLLVGYDPEAYEDAGLVESGSEEIGEEDV